MVDGILSQIAQGGGPIGPRTVALDTAAAQAGRREEGREERKLGLLESEHGIKMESLLAEQKRQEAQAHKAERLGILRQQEFDANQRAAQAQQLAGMLLFGKESVPPNQLSTYLNQVADAAERDGVFPKEVIDQFRKDVVDDPQGALDGALAALGSAPEQAEPDRANIVPRDSNRPVTASIDPQTNIASFFDQEGNQQFLRPGEYSITGQNITGTSEEVLGDTEARQLRDAEVATKQFLATTGDALSLLQDSPDINTFAGRFAGLVNDLQQEGKAVARALGKEFDENILDPTRYSDSTESGVGFDELGIQNRRMQSIITSLAFQAAAASGQTGRSVSDRDVRRFIGEIGASAADPRAFAVVLRDVAERTARNFRLNYESRLGRSFEGDLGLENLRGGSADARDAQASDEKVAETTPLISTPEEYEALPSGLLYRHPDGTIRQKK